MGKLKNKQAVNITIDKEVLEVAKCYINNLSNFFETCLKNFIKKNSDLIENDNFLTSRMKLKEIEETDLPDITYIINKLNSKIVGYEIVNNRVYSKKSKSFRVPDERLTFLKGNKMLYKDTLFFIDYNTLPIEEKQEEINDFVKWW